uniref:Alpha 1,3-galactosyltransferase 2 n=1 Tax=Latimeria chalumnae TaxID=7897 RepID=H3AG18_LATCH
RVFNKRKINFFGGGGGFLFSLPHRHIERKAPMAKCNLSKGARIRPGNDIDNTLDLWSRSDVQTCMPWGAPVIWEGTFDARQYDEYYRKRNVTVGLTVFAVGKYLDVFLETFLITAEWYFMIGHNVIYYVFTDQPNKVPKVPLANKRLLRIIPVSRHQRWQDVSMLRMKSISEVIDIFVSREAQYLFCMDVDQFFEGRFGVETLSDSVAQMHSWFYHRFSIFYSYDRNPKSAAYMGLGEGDLYYHAAVFGGTWQKVKHIVDSCYQGIWTDKQNNVEALWHDESHLNKYFWLHKPSKVLSPEYCWDDVLGTQKDIFISRLSWAKKQYEVVREKTEKSWFSFFF